MRLALISKSRVAGLFVPLGPPPGLILTVGHVGCNWRCANLAVNAFLVPPQLYTVGIDINVKIADMAYWTHNPPRVVGVQSILPFSLRWLQIHQSYWLFSHYQRSKGEPKKCQDPRSVLFLCQRW